MIILRYIGEGRWMSGVPSRDLNEADLAALREQDISEQDLLHTGLFERIEQKADKRVHADKVLYPGRENK